MNALEFSIWQVTFYNTLYNQRVLNTFHYRLNDLTGTPTVEQVADALYAAMNASDNLIDRYLDVQTEELALTQVWIQQISPIRSAAYKYTTSKTGSVVAEQGVTNLAGVLTRRGAGGTRRDVGSIHLPLPNIEAYIDAGQVTETWKTAVQPYINLLTNNITLLTGDVLFGPVIYNPGATPNYTPIDVVFAQDTVRVMRRRTVGLGI